MIKVKKILIGTALSGILVASAGIGTYSWYTAQKEAAGQIVNGTFSLGDMGQLFQHEKFAPSQLLMSDWNSINNTGDLDQLLRVTYTHSVDNNAVNVKKYKVGYIAVKSKLKPDGTYKEVTKAKLNALLNGTTNMVTAASDNGYTTAGAILTSSADPNAIVTSKTSTLGDGSKFWSLKPGEHIDIIFGVKLSENAGNEFQGVKYDANFKVEAKQTDNGSQYQADLGAVNNQ